jgi:3-methyl-2-oxobutanoate hydroxymethyltransferase
VNRALIVADLPIGTYRNPEQALRSARRLTAAGAESVKMEGGMEILPQVRRLVRHGIPFLGHIGMLPQRIREEGRYRKKGKTSAEITRLREEALCLEEAGAWGVVLESIVPEIAEDITKSLSIPTIGVGSGPHCSGQILVNTDLFGSYPWFVPPFAKPEADVAGEIVRAATAYRNRLKQKPVK